MDNKMEVFKAELEKKFRAADRHSDEIPEENLYYKRYNITKENLEGEDKEMWLKHISEDSISAAEQAGTPESKFKLYGISINDNEPAGHDGGPATEDVSIEMVTVATAAWIEKPIEQ